MARHKDLVDKEALSIDIAEARSWREHAREDVERREKERLASQLQDSITWLGVGDCLQENELDRLSRRRQPDTCDWILKTAKFKSWKKEAYGEPLMWLRGIPGAGWSSHCMDYGEETYELIIGKSVLCSHIIHSLKSEPKLTTIYYFCNSQTDGRDVCNRLMRTLALQLLRAHIDLAPHISDNYTQRGYNPSMQQLRKLLPELLATTQMTRIVIDGLDECQGHDQRTALQELISLCSPSLSCCKILFSSREGVQISKVLSRKPSISLRDERSGVDPDIRLFVHQHLADLRERFHGEIIDNIEEIVVNKADGKAW